MTTPLLFNGRLKSSLNFLYNSNDIIQYNIVYDIYNNWDINENKYTISIDGFYNITSNITSNYNTNLKINLIHYRNDSIISTNFLYSTQYNSSSEGFYILECLENDKIWLSCLNNNSYIYNNEYGSLEIKLL